MRKNSITEGYGRADLKEFLFYKTESSSDLSSDSIKCNKWGMVF